MCSFSIQVSLGMKEGLILDSQITASSILNPSMSAKYGRRGSNGWAPKKAFPGEYLQIDLLIPKKISKVATQGRRIDFEHYIKTYMIKYSDDGAIWSVYKENGTIKVNR